MTTIYAPRGVLLAMLALAPAVAPAADSVADGPPAVPGADKSGQTRVLEAGARALQSASPAAALDLHLTGLHPLRDEPSHQLVAHHYCHQVNEDFAQCALFDGDGAQARLNGVEYIISARLFERLPEPERRFWHPHNYEILSGQLQAPGLPAAAEKAFLRNKMNSYGKTWHVWHTGGAGGRADALPLGEPRLAWSFNRDGEAAPALLDDYFRRLGQPEREAREERAELRELARPQSGVDELKGEFGRPTRELPGVRDSKAPPSS